MIGQNACMVANIKSGATVCGTISGLNVAGLLPASDFSTTNTVSSAISNVSDKVDEVSGCSANDFLKGKYIAHQGACTSAPGNSEWAFICAGRCGYSIAECDVQKTSDGKFVLSHSDELSDMTDHIGYISQTDYSTLSTYSITKGYNADIYSQGYCTLERYLDICREFGMVPLIEDNSNPSGDDCLSIIGIVLNCGFKNALYMSGYVDNCIKVKTQHPFINTVFVKSSPTSSDISACASARVSAIHCAAANIDAQLVTSVHEAGMLIGAWNTGGSDAVKYMHQIGVDFINIDGYAYCTPDTASTSDEIAVGFNRNIPYYSEFTFDLAKRGMFTTGGAFTSASFSNLDNVSFSRRLNYGYMGPFSASNMVFEIRENSRYDYAIVVIPINSQQAQLDTSWLNITGTKRIVAPQAGDMSTVNDDAYTFVVAKKKNGDAVFGDMDFIDASQYVSAIEQNVFSNYSLTSTGWKYVRGEMQSKLIPVNAGDAIPYDGTNLPANLKCLVVEFKADFTSAGQQGWITTAGTATMPANSKYVGFYFKQYNGDWSAYDYNAMLSVSSLLRQIL